MPEGHGREVVALAHEGRLLRRRMVDIGRAQRLQRRRVLERDVAGERIGPLHQIGVEPVDHAVTVWHRLGIGLGMVEGDAAGRPVRRYLARVDLVHETAVDDPLGPGRRADRHVVGIDACDPGDRQ